MSKVSDCPCLGGTLDELIRPAILAALSHGPLHGCELAERIGEMTSCSAREARLVRYLPRPEGDGSAAFGGVLLGQAGERNARRCFQITAEGKACLARWTVEVSVSALFSPLPLCRRLRRVLLHPQLHDPFDQVVGDRLDRAETGDCLSARRTVRPLSQGPCRQRPEGTARCASSTQRSRPGCRAA